MSPAKSSVMLFAGVSRPEEARSPVVVQLKKNKSDEKTDETRTAVFLERKKLAPVFPAAFENTFSAMGKLLF